MSSELRTVTQDIGLGIACADLAWAYLSDFAANDHAGHISGSFNHDAVEWRLATPLCSRMTCAAGAHLHDLPTLRLVIAQRSEVSFNAPNRTTSLR